MSRPFPNSLSISAPVLLVGALLIASCRQDMHDQPRKEPYEGNTHYADGRSDRPQVEGTIARGQLQTDELLFTGKEGGELALRFPFPVTARVLERGRERFDIYCAVCHERTGYGLGMAVQLGFRQPTSFHDDRLREAPPGYFFDVITNGFGAMFDYSDRILPRDRWAIVSYIRALQASQNVPVDTLPERIQRELSEAR